tara:strand:- start:1888 stop:3285 length:1398 start_codon:yes stop_codon:yes gene_type:complete
VLTLEHLKEIWGEPTCMSSLNLNTPLGSICTDSRNLKAGDFFVPLRGEKFDGHRFLGKVFELGAQAAVVSSGSIYDIPPGFVHWVVDDTLHAYQQLALLHRSELDIPVIAITGSVGKTTTRELIKAVLSPLGSVVASRYNNNNDIGVPLTLLAAQSSDAALVVEMGMRGHGEIERLSRCAQPDIAVITNIGSAHIGRLGSRRNIAKAKCEITSYLKKSGIVVIPAGDSLLEEELRMVWKGRVLRVTLQSHLPHRDFECNDSSLAKFKTDDLFATELLDTGRLSLEGNIYKLPLPGRHNAVNFLLALAVARELGIAVDSLCDLEVQVPSGRHTIMQIGQVTFIDETYNASPEAVDASLELLIAMPGRHFAVLGTMLELGEHSVKYHRQLAEHVVRLGLDGVVIVACGDEASAMREVVASMNCFALVNSPEEAFLSLIRWLGPGDVVLVKGSRGVALERLITLFKNK